MTALIANYLGLQTKYEHGSAGTCFVLADSLLYTLPWRGRVARARRCVASSGAGAGWGDLSASEMLMISTTIRRAAAKKLRANTTPHERILWRALKELPIDGTHFRRQAPIGPYVVDFFCPAAHLIIELDGGHHNEDDTAKRDRERQLWLEREGYRVVRFWNSEITGDLNAVMERIYVELFGSREAESRPLKHHRRR
jgi:very-short-patch-repair endonuclease